MEIHTGIFLLTVQDADIHAVEHTVLKRIDEASYMTFKPSLVWEIVGHGLALGTKVKVTVEILEE